MMPLYAIPSLFSAIVLFGLSLFVITRNIRSLTNLSFAVTLSSEAFLQLSHYFLLRSQDELWLRISFACVWLILSSLALFSVTFSRQHHREGLQHWKWILAVIIIGSCGFSALGWQGKLFAAAPRFSFERFHLYTLQPAGQYFLLFTFFCLLFILHNLENTYRNAPAPIRWKIKFLVLGIFASSFFYIFLISAILLYKTAQVEYSVAEAIILLISSALIVFSLVRHRLMDTDVFISRQVVFNSFVLFVVGAYLLTIAIIGYLIKYELIPQQFTQFLVAEIFMYVALIGLAAFLLSEEIRRKVERYISKHFYKHKYDYDEVWIAFTRRIGSNISLDALLPQIVMSLQDIVKTDQVYLFLSDETKHTVALAQSSRQIETPLSLSMDSALITYFQGTDTPEVDTQIFKAKPELHHIYAELQDVFDEFSIALCAPLKVKDHFLGLLAIGPERTGEQYSHEDYDLLHTISAQAASMILNARLTENLSQARALETFHKFAAFIIHDLKNAVQNLSFVVQNSAEYFDDPEFRDDAITTIADTATRMNAMITRLSSVPEKLELHITEAAVLPFLEDTLKKSKVSKLNHIRLHVDVADPDLTLPIDQHHFQSVFLNLLSNAAEAIGEQDGEITIRASLSDGKAKIAVQDTGSGMSADHLKSLFTPFKTTKKKGLGIGLYQCKTIVEAHQGKIFVESEVGQGTTFRIELPVLQNDISSFS